MEKQRHTCLGTGIFNLDTIVVREYPDGDGRRKFVENIAAEEVGGTCGNVMCMLSHLGWQALPLSKFDDSEEGLKMTSAAFIDALGRSGPLNFGSLTADRVRDALSDAQKVASSSVSYLGSKGMIHVPDTV